MSIRKQGLGHSVVNYLGVAISFFSTLFIYNLDVEVYGFAQFIVNTANFLIPFLTFGVVALVLRYYPEFRDGKGSTNFILSILFLFVLVVGFCSTIFYLFKGEFIQFMQWIKVDRKGIVEPYFNVILFLAIVIGYIRVITLHSSNLKRIIFPEILNNLAYKIFLPILIFMSYYDIIDRHWMIVLLVGWFVCVALALSIYVFRSDTIKGRLIRWKDIVEEKRNEIRDFTFINAFNAIGGSFAFRVDMIMLSAMIGFTSNGIYALLLFLSNVIDIPRKSLNKIVSPYLAKAAAENDKVQIEKLYKKASITLLVPSLFITLMIWTMLPELDKIAVGKPVFYANKYLFVFLAMGRLLGMLFSTNGEILNYSKFYRYHLLFLAVLAIVNVSLNYVFISRFEILGAAMATFCALVIYNVMKGAFIFSKMNLSPFHRNTWKLLLLVVINLAVLNFIPIDLPIWQAVPLKSALLLALYGVPAIRWNVSPDINEMAFGVINKIRDRR